MIRKSVIAIGLLILVVYADQALKFWVKHHMAWQEQIPMLGKWFRLHFTENNGMAFGIELGDGEAGKLVLTWFRIIAVSFGFWYLWKFLKEDKSFGLLICVSLILAGAIGNIIDSIFYGVWFNDINRYTTTGYFHGRVVDMLYFPLIEGTFPKWFPIWSGEEFVFFSPVFNLADAAISAGVISLLVFQKRFFGVHVPEKTAAEVKTEGGDPQVTDNTSHASQDADELNSFHVPNPTGPSDPPVQE